MPVRTQAVLIVLHIGDSSLFTVFRDWSSGHKVGGRAGKTGDGSSNIQVLKRVGH